MSRLYFHDGTEVFQGGVAKVLPFKQRSEAPIAFNVIPVASRNDKRILKMDRVSTKQLDALSYIGVIMVIIPGAIIFVPKPVRKW